MYEMEETRPGNGDPVSLPVERGSRVGAVVRTGVGIALLAGGLLAASVALKVVLGVVGFPELLRSHSVAVFVAVGVAISAAQWLRDGVRRRLRDSVAGKVEEFGGGAYGAAAAGTWAYLEVVDLVGEVAAAGSLRAFVEGVSASWVIAQLVESLQFAVQAMIWPLHWFTAHGLWAAGVVAVAAWGVDLLAVRVPWLRREGEWSGVAPSEENP